MASPNVWPGGLNLSGTVFDGGPSMLAGAAWLSGAIQFVDTVSGNNANSGAQPELAVATLAQAVTNSAANGVILIGSGSAQSLNVVQTLNLAGLRIIGCGAGTSRPRYTCALGAANMFDITAAGVAIENIYFPQSTVGGAARVGFGAASGEVRDCYFECGSLDSVAGVLCAASSANTLIKGCTFVSTSSRPALGLELSTAVADICVDSCTFDGGAFGWSADAFRVSAGATRIKIRDVQLLRRSDFNATTTGTTYQAFDLTADGTSRVVWTA